jgi:hypothetical protein
MVGTSKLRPASERMTAALWGVEPFESGSWHAVQPCVFQRDRRTSRKSCSPRASFFGSKAGTGGTGVIGSSTSAGGVLYSCVDPVPGASEPGTNNAAAAMYAHDCLEEMFNRGSLSMRLDVHGEPVADAPFRLDHAGSAGIRFQLAP